MRTVFGFLALSALFSAPAVADQVIELQAGSAITIEVGARTRVTCEAGAGGGGAGGGWSGGGRTADRLCLCEYENPTGSAWYGTYHLKLVLIGRRGDADRTFLLRSFVNDSNGRTSCEGVMVKDARCQ